MLKRIFLMRHGQSLEDVDPTLHNIRNEKAAELTKTGKEQSTQLALKLKTLISPTEKVHVYVSPALRAQETWGIISTQIDNAHSVTTDQRIRNLNWGNITLANRAEVEAERYKVGVLNFTFPEGDHTPDYVRSLNDFLDSVVTPTKGKESDIGILLFMTHGFALRVILKHLLLLTEEDFKWLRNPPNCYIIELAYDSETNSFTAMQSLSRMDPI